METPSCDHAGPQLPDAPVSAIPAACPRCAGFLYRDLDETRCLLCAWRPPYPAPVRERVNFTCQQCHRRDVERGKKHCATCLKYYRTYRE